VEVKATKKRIEQALPLLRRAARAKVEYYNALREIEQDVIGYDVHGLDDGVDGLAFNCDLPEDADKITEADAKAVIQSLEREQ
jgi:hypothetical protein